MKEFSKNVLKAYGMVALFVMCFGLVEFTLGVVRVVTGLTDGVMYGIMLAAALIGGAIKTGRERRRKKRAAEYVPVILESAIEVQRSLLQDGKVVKDRSQNNIWRELVIKTTLAALEEKRERIISGKDRRGKHESRLNEHETQVVGENPGRGKAAGDPQDPPAE